MSPLIVSDDGDALHNIDNNHFCPYGCDALSSINNNRLQNSEWFYEMVHVIQLNKILNVVTETDFSSSNLRMELTVRTLQMIETSCGR